MVSENDKREVEQELELEEDLDEDENTDVEGCLLWHECGVPCC